ncbi:MAG: thiamine phosphate synthase [Pseudomonadota bacterium]
MTDDQTPQIYLVTPAQAALSVLEASLPRLLDEVPVACVRLAPPSDPEDAVRAADTLRTIAHARDVPLVVLEAIDLVERVGLDGVHLSDGANQVATARRTLGQEAIVGAFCGVSRHAGMTAGEHGADYIAFSAGDSTETDLFAWWSEMIELPVVAEGGLDLSQVAALTPVVDFFALGPEVWDAEAPVDALKRYHQAMSQQP